MKRLLIAIAAMFLLSIGVAAPVRAQTFAQPGMSSDRADYSTSPVVPGVSRIGSPTYVQVQKSAGFITIGRAFGDFLEPYIDAAIQALIAALISWLCWELKRRTGIEIDKGHRDAITRALTNQAASLIADGMVRVDGAKIDVHSPALARAADEVMKVVPDAAKHFGITPEYVANRIVDTIPQVAAGAQLTIASMSRGSEPQTLP